jgi:hypothetical protein
MAVLLADRDMVNIVEEQRKMLQQTRYTSSCGEIETCCHHPSQNGKGWESSKSYHGEGGGGEDDSNAGKGRRAGRGGRGF